MAYVLVEGFNSSNITKFWYDAETQQLIVEYVGGAQYRYDNVSNSDYQGLCEAPSKGTYINESIKSKPYQKMVLKD